MPAPVNSNVRCNMYSMLNVIAAFLITLIPLAAQAQDQVLPAAAHDVLVSYSSALNQGNCDAMLELTSPAVISRMARSPDGKEDFCEMIRSFHNEMLVESLGKVLGTKSEGMYHMAMVENQRIAERRDSTMVGGKSFYVLHSSDGGERWWVLDNLCIDSDWIKEVYPPYDGDPPIPE